MIESLNHIDTEVFLFLNGLHNSVLDFVMYWLSDRFIWIPMYLLLIFLIIKKYKKRSWLILLLIGLMITTTDQLTVFMKNYFQRPRPCHQEDLQVLIHLVKDKCGGPYGFVSSHAGNSFSLAIFLIPFLKPGRPYFVPFILTWAIIVSYSRIYLGVHFPGDVLAGALTGSLIGFLYSKIFFLFYPGEQNK